MNKTIHRTEIERAHATFADNNHIKHQDGMDEVIAAVMQRAVEYAQQSGNSKAAQEAWEFLDICAPTVATELRYGRKKTMKGSVHNDSG